MRRLLLGLLLVGFSLNALSRPVPDDGFWVMNGQGHTDDVIAGFCDDAAAQGYYVYLELNADGTTVDTCWRRDDDPCIAPESWDNSTYACQLPGCDGDGDPDGSVYDPSLESCQCPEGTTDFFGTDGSYSCVPKLPECTSSEPTFLGYLNDQPVCSYDGQCASGEQGGLVDGEWVCLPDACDGGTYINGACISPDDTTSQPQTEHSEPDTDGDGTPDSQDDDIDGDGTSNSQDDDIDGDGVLNPDDQSNEDQGSATAQGGCDQPPSCTGDAQECALLKQQWYAMCYTEDYQSDQGGFYDPDSSDDIETRLSGAISDFKTRVEGAPAVAGIDNFFSLAGGGSCPSYSVSAWVFDITLDQWCSSEIPWGMISGLLFAVALLIAARIAVA